MTNITIFLAIYKNRMRYNIIRELIPDKTLTTDDLVTILGLDDVPHSKSKVFSQLCELEDEEIIENKYITTYEAGHIKVQKSFKIRDGKRDIIQMIIRLMTDNTDLFSEEGVIDRLGV